MRKEDKIMYKVSKGSQRGQGIVVLGVFISVIVILIVGLFSFEINRVEVCRQQLRSATEAAALAAAATLASQDNLDAAEAHTQAISTAVTSFKQNSVAGISLNDATIAGTVEDTPAAEDSSLFIEFLDPNNNFDVVALGNPAGKQVRITSAFGLKPSFGAFLGLPTVPLRTTATGGVPDLDIILCFDVSGSIDDQTPVTFVKRVWSGSASTGNTTYTITASNGSPNGSLASGRIYDIIGPVPTGTRVNGVPPQYLSSANSNNRWNIYFSEASGTGSARGLRGSQNAGSRPGNCPPGTASTGTTRTFTDLVVNIDGRNTFAGLTTGDGYAFPNLGTLVEAARGNLENNTVFVNSGASRSLPASVTPRAGYQAKYLEMAKNNLHPLKDAQTSANEFFTIMNTNTCGHFGLICFSDNAGSSPSTTYNDYVIDSNYAAGGRSNYPIYNIAINPTIGITNYDTITNVLPNTVATTATNIGDALDRAVTQLRNNSRPASKKAIVLFTDGMPTAGGPLHSDPWTNARQAARRARDAGIPIYSIGLAQNPEIIPDETAILTDANSDVSTGGVSGIAGHGGKFFLVTNADDLRRTFENIARQLVQLVK